MQTRCSPACRWNGNASMLPVSDTTAWRLLVYARPFAGANLHDRTLQEFALLSKLQVSWLPDWHWLLVKPEVCP